MIDAEKFRPKKRGESDKFSWNIYRFIKKHPGIRVLHYTSPNELVYCPYDSQKS